MRERERERERKRERGRERERKKESNHIVAALEFGLMNKLVKLEKGLCIRRNDRINLAERREVRMTLDP